VEDDAVAGIGADEARAEAVAEAEAGNGE